MALAAIYASIVLPEPAAAFRSNVTQTYVCPAGKSKLKLEKVAIPDEKL